MGQPSSSGPSSSASYSISAGIALAETELHALTVSMTGTGSGKVTSSPAGIDCASDCSESYGAGDDITLTATEDAGSKFIGWSGCNSVSGNTCAVTMDTDKKITALFGLSFGNQYSLALSKSGNGTGTITIKGPDGQISCGTDCNETGAVFNSGTKITLKAVVNTGSAFGGWTGNACNGSKKTSCTVTMTADVTLTAAFDLVPLNQYILTLSKNGNGTTSAVSFDKNISCGADCTETKTVFDAGTKITLTAVADAGSGFAVWYGNACNGSKKATCTIKIRSDMNMVANFKSLPVLKFKKLGTGAGTVTSSPAGISCGPDCTSQEYSPDLWQTVHLKAKPDTGSKFIKWSGDICNGSKQQTCKISKMLNDKEVTANFGRSNVSVSTQGISFDDTSVGQSSTQTFTITNSGDADVIIKQLKVSSANGTKEASMFKLFTNSIPEKSVSKATIQAGGSLEIKVKFKPAADGQKSATLKIISDDPEEPLIEISLVGSGLISSSSAKKTATARLAGQSTDDFVTREEMAAITVGNQQSAISQELPDNYCEDASPFADVSPDRWSCKYIKRLRELGVSGCDETEFCPDDYITREEMAYLIVSSQPSIAISLMSDDHCATGSPFIDVPADRWSCKYIKRLYELGLTAEKDGQMFRPEDFVTQKQIETLLRLNHD